MRLVLVRHGESVWNKENKFTGWTDVGLSEKGIEEAKNAGRMLEDYHFDVVYTSVLKRAKDTYKYIREYLKEKPACIEDYRLNERHYGALQGLNKEETRLKYGDEQVKLWRRSFDVRPPLLDESDERFPGFDPLYEGIPKYLLPRGESLKDTLVRVEDFYRDMISKANKDASILIVAHGNSLRALIKYLEGISDEDIVNVEIPTGKPIVYKLDENNMVICKDAL